MKVQSLLDFMVVCLCMTVARTRYPLRNSVLKSKDGRWGAAERTVNVNDSDFVHQIAGHLSYAELRPTDPAYAQDVTEADIACTLPMWRDTCAPGRAEWQAVGSKGSSSSCRRTDREELVLVKPSTT